ncbi:Crp/Fnr family transcriptional regulator [Flaviaesturariibacter terrae]
MFPLDRLMDQGTVQTFAAGETLLREGGWIRQVPVVLRGSLRVLRSDEKGRELLLYYIRPGESCVLSLLGGLHRNTSKVQAIAEEESDVLLLPVDRIRELLRSDAALLDYVLHLYQQRFEELLDVVNAVAFRRVDERLLAFLERKSGLMGTDTIDMTHEQIAAELGTSRVIVSRLLKRLEEEGTVALGRHRLTLKRLRKDFPVM